MKMSIDVQKKWDGDTFRLTILPKVKYNSVREAALFCQGQAVLLCPVDSGRLRSSIGVKFKGQKVIQGGNSGKLEPDDLIKEEPAEGEAHVGTNVVYAAQKEFGGVINAKAGGALTFKTKDGKWHTVKSVTQAPQPYLRPAADITEGKAITIIERAGQAEFEKYKDIK